MTDLIFSTLQQLPPEWRIVYQSGRYQLAVRDDSGPHVFHYYKRSNTILAYLSNRVDPLDTALFEQSRFVCKIGTAAGILWHTQSDEFCIFRDAFGMIPWLSTPGRGIFTTDPEFHAQIHAHSPLNPRWFATFLQDEFSTAKDDVYVGSERILPGESLYHVTTDSKDFLRDCSAEKARTPGFEHTETIQAWDSMDRSPLAGTRAEIAEGLRKALIASAARIPSSDLCFTLSGGLDSSGIVAAYLQSHTGPIDAVTLISNAHASCDESREVTILEKALPIHLTRLSMDASWPLSEPALYDFKGYGPSCAPGIESTVNMFRAIQDKLGPRTIITGYGGNFIVKARAESVWRHLLRHPDPGAIIKELKAVRQNYVLSRRIMGNIAGGKLKALYRRIHPQKSGDPNDPKTWLVPAFANQYAPNPVDPYFFMSQAEERAQLIMSWECELCMRALDMIARQTKHHFYDGLFDFDLYAYCARIPPQYFLEGGNYRPIYREALTPLLPPEIITHPKCQSFDDLMHDGLAKYGRPIIESAIQALDGGPLQGILQADGLAKAYQTYCSAIQAGKEIPLITFWHALGAALWAQY